MFIGVPGALTFEEFTHNFCSVSLINLAPKTVTNKGDSTTQGTQGEERLKTVVRSFTHRRTHESRLFSAPLVSLPMISETHVQVDLCSAEKLINEELQNYFINKLNGKIQQYSKETLLLTLDSSCRKKIQTNTLHSDTNIEMSHVYEPLAHCAAFHPKDPQ